MNAPRPEIMRGFALADYDNALATLNATRRAEGISLTDLADDAGVIPQQLADWLRGELFPDAATFFAIADALGFDLALIPREDAP